MSNRDGKRWGRRQGTVPGRSKQVPRTNGTGPARNSAAPIGSLVIQKNGKSRFYPEGGRDRPGAARDPASAAPPRRGKGSRSGPGTQHVYFNGLFGKQPPVDPYTTMPMDGESVASDDAVARPMRSRAANLRSALLCCFFSVIVFIIIALAIIFPVIFVASTATGASVTGTVRLNTPFVSAFNDANSTQYVAQATAFQTAMDQIFQDSSAYSRTFSGTRVTDLKPGPTLDTTEVSFALDFDVGTDDTPSLRNALFAFITMEIARSGSSVNALSVVQGSLRITESCNVYCATGSLTISSCTCA